MLEAETTALNVVGRPIGMAALDLCELVLGRKVGIDVMEDNETFVVVVTTGTLPSDTS